MTQSVLRLDFSACGGGRRENRYAERGFIQHEHVTTPCRIRTR